MFVKVRMIRWLVAPALLLAGGALRAQQPENKPVPPTPVNQPAPPTPADQGDLQRRGYVVSRPVQVTQSPFHTVTVSQWDQELGVRVAQADETLRTQLELPDKQGLVVTALRGNSPAAKAGLRRYDILLTAAERPLKTVGDLLQSHRHDAGADQPLKVKLLRGGKEQTVEVGPIQAAERNAGLSYTVHYQPLIERPDLGYYIGVETAPVGEALRSHLEIAQGKGLVVTAVHEGNPAEKAGLKKNDILLSFGEKELADEPTLRAAIQERKDKATPVKLLRGGKPITVEVTPAKREATQTAHWEVQTFHNPEEYWVGLPAGPVDATLREHLALAAGKGLIVGDVPPESPAGKAGFKKHDILLKAGDKDLTGEDQLRAAVQEAKDKPLSFTLLRAGKETTLAVTPEKRPASQLWLNAMPQNLQFVGPGVLTGQPNTVLFSDPNNLPQAHLGVFNPPQLAAGPDAVQKKLDDLSAQLERLTKAVDDLRASIHAEGAGKK
jgi:S1-C subfamily serine protease